MGWRCGWCGLFCISARRAACPAARRPVPRLLVRGAHSPLAEQALATVVARITVWRIHVRGPPGAPADGAPGNPPGRRSQGGTTPLGGRCMLAVVVASSGGASAPSQPSRAGRPCGLRGSRLPASSTAPLARPCSRSPARDWRASEHQLLRVAAGTSRPRAPRRRGWAPRRRG